MDENSPDERHDMCSKSHESDRQPKGKDNVCEQKGDFSSKGHSKHIVPIQNIKKIFLQTAKLLYYFVVLYKMKIK